MSDRDQWNTDRDRYRRDEDKDWRRGSGDRDRNRDDYARYGEESSRGQAARFGRDEDRSRGVGGMGGSFNRDPDMGRRDEWSAGSGSRGRQDQDRYGQGYGRGREDYRGSGDDYGRGRGGEYSRGIGEFGDEASGQSFAGNEGRGFGYRPDRGGRWDADRLGGNDRGDRGGYGYSREDQRERGNYGSARDDYRERGGRDEQRGWWDRTSDEVASWFGDKDAERRREEDHRGRGPKGYTRSDERIRDDISDRLTDDRHVDASELDVQVANGEVTLSGTVQSREERRRAEDIAESVSGVKHVQNSVRVASGGQARGGRADAFGAGAQQGQGKSTVPGLGLTPEQQRQGDLGSGGSEAATPTGLTSAGMNAPISGTNGTPGLRG